METVLLLGIGPTALSALESLAGLFHVAAVIRDVSPDAIADDEVATLAQERGIPLLTDTTVTGVRRAITDYQPTCTVVSSYNRVLPKDIVEQRRFVNVHYAPLPKYRGRANVNWAIINGEPETAISIHVLTAELDSGNILYQQRIPIAPDDTVTDLYEKLNSIQCKALGPTVERFISGYPGERQEESAASYGCTRVPEDGEIDWSGSTKQVYALIRALTPPYPGAFTYLDTRRIYLIRAVPLTDAPRYVGRIPGRVVGRSSRHGYVDVLTGDSVLRIHEAKADDSAVRPASEFITSTKQTLGLRTANLLARLKAVETRSTSPCA